MSAFQDHALFEAQEVMSDRMRIIIVDASVRVITMLLLPHPSDNWKWKDWHSINLERRVKQMGQLLYLCSY